MTSTIAPPDTGTDTEERDFPFRSSISTHPAPMTVSRNPSKPTKASLDVLISNDGFNDIEFESLTIAFTVADNDWGEDAPGILTPVWNKVSWPKPELPPGWVEDTSNPEPGVFTFKSENNEAGPNDALRLHLDNIHVSAIKGIAEVVISIDAPSGRPEFKDAIHSIGKFPIGFELKNFRADDPIVENGQATKLNWTAGRDDAVDYKFYVNGVEKELEGGRIEPPFDTGPLHTTTVYKIVANHQVGSEWLPYSDSTVVHVHGGELTASSALIAGKRPALIEPLPTWEEEWSFTFLLDGRSCHRGMRPCDGLIVGELRIILPERMIGKPSGGLTVQMVCKGFPTVEVELPLTREGRYSGHTGQQILMPVPGGEPWEVKIIPVRKTSLPKGSRVKLKLYWVSLAGDGQTPETK